MTTTPTETDALTAAQAQVRAYCRWWVAPSEDVTWTLDGPGCGVLVLPTLFVSAITSITEDGLELDPACDYTWSETGVVRRTWGPSVAAGSLWWRSSWRVDQQRPWTNTQRGIEVQATHGYDDWPAEVAALIDRLVARAGTGTVAYTQVGLVRTAVGTDGLPLTATLTETDQAVLDPYRLPHRA